MLVPPVTVKSTHCCRHPGPQDVGAVATVAEFTTDVSEATLTSSTAFAHRCATWPMV